jgi:hypothetical protein
MIQPDQYQILRRMLTHGEPVQKTISGFKLHGEEFLCRMADMSKLWTLKLVELVSVVNSAHYELNGAGRAAAQRKEIWQLLQEEYFNDTASVPNNVAIDKTGFVVG